jgi:hypothetical protein
MRIEDGICSGHETDHVSCASAAASRPWQPKQKEGIQEARAMTAARCFSWLLPENVSTLRFNWQEVICLPEQRFHNHGMPQASRHTLVKKKHLT